ncbi:hypothetical protein MLD38_039434 [Melastoma candidum]|uniref:Uncharacterized protein n=1 Tax=Melastoma candidum TaxID=119954 RepID=A0ACB9L2Z7_9MYRT|nr:hypothetical protein MLD38_039434 [Melastoma candidum]
MDQMGHDGAKPEEKPTVHELRVGVRDVTGPSRIRPPPLTRQFWRAGSYDGGDAGTRPKTSVSDGENYAHVHPMFLHSNATSHKWVFGAVAELLDNAIDEIQNGATSVRVDRTENPKDGRSALLIQDDGGGMDPEALRRCMSFGFSDKKSKAAIGQYGNGFKTSTMRLGADVIVFSRHKGDRMHSQSIGLLSYTFLSQTGCNRIIVPMVDYDFNESTGTVKITHLYGKDHYDSNLSLLLQWSPYSTEAELLKQFNDIGTCGTKVVIYNLWMTEDQKMELDFDSDPLDIRLSGDIKKVTSKPQWKSLNEKHLANQLHYSLRVYLSILYLRLPDSFTIVLRGQAVEHHNIADDLKYIEYILYTPKTGGTVEGQVVTTIGFLKEAPNVSIHGFNVYHKNRLILGQWFVVIAESIVIFRQQRQRSGWCFGSKFYRADSQQTRFRENFPFSKVGSSLKGNGQGILGISLWTDSYHAGLKRLQSGCIVDRSRDIVQNTYLTPVTLSTLAPPTNRTNEVPISPLQNRCNQGSNMKRKAEDLPENKKEIHLEEWERYFWITWGTKKKQTVNISQTSSGFSEVDKRIGEHRMLRAKCLEYEKSERQLEYKLANLRSELENAQKEYSRLLARSRFLEQISQDWTKK